MERGFWILIWDGWERGLNMINPRLYTTADGRNWFTCATEGHKDDIIRLLKLDEQYGEFYKLLE